MLQPGSKRSRQIEPGSGLSRLARDAASGLIAAVITIAYCVSFGALLFQGELTGGLSLGLAALLTGTAVTGLIVALASSLSPAAAGPDTPAIAVMTVLATTVAAKVAGAGGSVDLAIEHVLLAITVSTLFTGLMLFAVGALRLGALLRFVPYPVIGGFLAASGLLLITGAVEVMIGRELRWDTLAMLAEPAALIKLAIGGGFAALVYFGKQRFDSYFFLPAAFFASALLLTGLLWLFAGSGGADWYLAGERSFHLWSPFAVIASGEIDWLVILAAAAEIGAVCGVTAIALLLDVSSLEVQRAKSADLDHEFRVNGIANVVAAAAGGVAGNLSLQSSVLVEEAGGVGRMAGVFTAIAIALVLMSGVNVAGLLPAPLLGGLLVYLGAVMLVQTLLRAPAQRSWTDFLLALAIMIVIIWLGYLVGVMLGLIGACLMFAFSYSRIGVVRRHLTRAEFASNIERSLEESQFLGSEGRRIHVFWLTGFIFFGSSNRVFEEIRTTIDTQTDPPIRVIVLDLSAVSGIDTSAVFSLVKLRNYCDEHDIEIVMCGVGERIEAALKESRFMAEGRRLRVFASRNDALEWCEDTVLDEQAVGRGLRAGFESWIAHEFGASDAAERIVAYFDRREIAAGTLLYEQGAASDTIDLVEAGRLAIMVRDEAGRPLRLRSMSGHTVVGEMGFFRDVRRAASVTAEEDAILYTLTRANMQRMLADDPDLATAFLAFIVRALADRVEFANREIAALI